MARLFIDRPILSIVIAIVMVIAGALRITGLPVAQFPEITPWHEKTVTSALGDVSTALVAKQKLARVKTELIASVTAYEEAVRIANTRYLSGLSSYFEVVNAQQQLFPAEILLARARRDELNVIVSLYKALGGGWQPPPENEKEP